MDRYYSLGDIIVLDNKEFCVKNVLGRGANSVVYLCEREEKGIIHIIKEYNPFAYDLYRNDDGKLVLNDNNIIKQKEYDDGRARFISGAQKQIEIRNKINSLTNYVSNVNEIYETNNTAYIDMTVLSGLSYDAYDDTNLEEILKHVRAISNAIKIYHDNEYLYLDLKPSNIFVVPETTDLTVFFDFDSVVSKIDLLNENGLYYSGEWAAPELTNYRFNRNISEGTDIFAIGEILFYKIFGRHSTTSERRSFSCFEYIESRFYSNELNPDVFQILTNIFRKTITSNINARYHNCSELLVDINDAILMANPHSLHIISTELLCNKNFVGRKKELIALNELLLKEKVVNINGIGGLGKTELVKQYAIDYSGNYKNIIYVSADGTWIDIVNNNISRNIINFSYSENEKADDLFERVIITITKLCTSEVLFIFDNVNIDLFGDKQAKYAEKVLGIPGKFIFTSRCVFEDFYNYSLDDLEEDDIQTLFFAWSDLENNEENKKDCMRLCEYVGKHTLTVELLAKQIKNDGYSICEKLEQLKKQGLPNIKGRVASTKDLEIKRAGIYEHLKALFCFDKLEIERLNVLFCVSLMPIDGVEVKMISKCCEDNGGEAIFDLVEKGWIRRKKGIISMHPLISEIVLEECSTSVKLDVFLQNVIEYIKGNIDNKYLHFVYDSIAEKLEKIKYKQIHFVDYLSSDLRGGLFVINGVKSSLKYNLMALDIVKACNYDYDNIVRIHLQIADMYNRLYENVSGIDVIDECLKYISDNNLSVTAEDYSSLYRILGSLYNDNADYESAGEALKKAERYALLVKDNEQLLFDLYLVMGSYYNDISDGEKTEKYYSYALELGKKLYEGNSYELAVAHGNLGIYYNWDGQYEKAIQELNESILLKERVFDDANNYSSLETLIVLSQAYLNVNDIEKSKEIIDRLFDIALLYYAEDDFFVAKLYSYKAGVYVSIPNYNDEADMLKSLELLEKLNASENHIGGYTDKYARRLESNNRYQDAIKYFKLALKYAEIACVEY